MICNFPSCIKGWLDVQDMNNDDMQIEDLKSSELQLCLNWRRHFCILMENDSKLYIFEEEPNSDEFPIPDHIGQCRLDVEIQSSFLSDSSSCIDDISTISSKNHDSDRYNSNSSLTHSSGNNNKSSGKTGIFRNGSRLFNRAKSNSKLNSSTPTGKDRNFETNSSAKSVSTLKRSLSLSRLIRKKSEEKPDSKSPRSTMKNNQFMTQSTGDLTMDVSSVCAFRHDLGKDSIISDVHTSLVGERPHCFSVSSLAVDINSDSDFDRKSKEPVFTKRIFAAKSLLEKQCWMKRLQHTLKPNMENENRLNNFLKITICESKFLPIQKRKYFCELSLDKNLYAKTTSKLSNNEGYVFWGEDLVLNDLPNLKTLNIHVYKEPDPVKDSKKKKRKNPNQCIGHLNFNISSITNKSEFQSWYPLKSVDRFSDLNAGNTIQLRVKLRYQSLKVLKCESYNKLYQIVIKNYLDLIQFLEKNLPVKLREEVASCLVNIHQSNGTIVEFISELISQEVNDLDNSSMTLRANTIVTKIIESHMKLVGSEYLHNMLHSFIHDVMYKNVTIEVDSSRLNSNVENPDKFILDNQHRLMEYLTKIWYKINDNRNKNFPRQLRLVFAGWRKILESVSKSDEEREKIATHCDVIVSGCIFLRLLCPAILSPHLFGLVSHFSDKTFVQRTLTLIAKSLQSLANFSLFGDKEHFMIFLNKYFEEEIPRMQKFLRQISTEPGENVESVEDFKTEVRKEIKYYGSTIDLSLELARLHNCLASDSMKENIIKSPKVQNIIKLPDIIREINHQLISYNPQTSSSFFSLKKGPIPVSSSNETRRSSLGPLVISKMQELSKPDKDNSPPRLGSPVCQSTSVVDPISEYNMHPNDVWQLRSDINCHHGSRASKAATTTPIVYSTKSQYVISPIPKHQMNVSTTHKGHYNTRENDDTFITDLPMKKNTDLKFFSLNSNPLHNQVKSSVPKSVQPQKNKIPISYPHPQPKNVLRFHEEPQYMKVNDPEFDSIKRKTKSTANCDVKSEKNLNEVYQANPLYDYVNISTRSSPEWDNYPVNKIDKFFNVRSRVNLLEQHLVQSNSDANKNQNLQDLYQEMENIKLELQNEQLKDLKQLKQIVGFGKSNTSKKLYSSCTNPHIEFSNCSEKDKSSMSETLDEVINAIKNDGAGLDEAQINLRRQHNKKDKFISQVSSSNRPRQQSLGAIMNTGNNETSLQTVPIELSESQAALVSSLSSTSVKSQSSSNCSSLTPWLI